MSGARDDSSGLQFIGGYEACLFMVFFHLFFFFSSRRRHTRCLSDWSSDVCSSDLVLLQKSFGAPVVTKDGVTVVKEIELEDKFENMGAKMIREVAQKTSDTAGDGDRKSVV